MNPILVLALSIIAHEFGHWIIPYHLGLNPRIKFGWIIIGVEFDMKKYTPIKTLVDTRILGILFGIPVIIILGNPGDLFFLFVFYFLLSSIDILMIIVLKVKAYQKDAIFFEELDCEIF